MVLISYLHTILQDLRSLFSYLDGLKTSYVVDNTKMIELDEVCRKHKAMLKQAQILDSECDKVATRVRNAKESVALKMFNFRTS